MNRLCAWLIILVLTPYVATAVEASTTDIATILKEFPGYHVLTLAERDSDAREFIRLHFPNKNPSIVQADFDGDGHADYAVLLRDSKTGKAKLAVLLCLGDATCKNVYELDLAGDFGDVYIRPVPIGSHVAQTDAIDTKNYPSPLKLHTVAIEVNYFGKAAVVCYWDQRSKKMQTIQTED